MNSSAPYNIISLKNGAEIALLGTAHVSRKSVDDVVESVETFNPDTICVELDTKRYENLKKQKQWQGSSLLSQILKGQGFMLVANLILVNYQHRLGKDLGSTPGAEMLKAAELAEKFTIPLVLCDRGISTTLKRAWRNCGFFSRLKILYTLFQFGFSKEEITEEDLQKLQENDTISEMMDNISRQIPIIKAVLIDERDVYLAQKIYSAQGNKKLAIIGAGHIRGVIQNLEKLDQGEKFSLEELEIVPPKSFFSVAKNWAFPLILTGLLIFVSYKSGKIANYSKFLVTSWLFWNVLFGGLGALFALAHPLAILTSAILSPVTSLVPFISSGPLVAAIQFLLKPPQVEDFENLRNLNNLTSWYRNRISHTLLIGLFSSIGSSLGAWIALIGSFSRSI